MPELEGYLDRKTQLLVSQGLSRVWPEPASPLQDQQSQLGAWSALWPPVLGKPILHPGLLKTGAVSGKMTALKNTRGPGVTFPFLGTGSRKQTASELLEGLPVAQPSDPGPSRAQPAGGGLPFDPATENYLVVSEWQQACSSTQAPLGTTGRSGCSGGPVSPKIL